MGGFKPRAFDRCDIYIFIVWPKLGLLSSVPTEEPTLIPFLIVSVPLDEKNFMYNSLPFIYNCFYQAGRYKVEFY